MIQTFRQGKYKSVVINNIWHDMNESSLIELIKATNLKLTKDMCFDIEIKVHKMNKIIYPCAIEQHKNTNY